MAQVQRMGNVFYRVHGMDQAVQFYQQVMGLSVKFRDGDRWAAFDVGGMTLALEGADQPPDGDGGATVSLRVDDLDAFVQQIRALGAGVGPMQTGAHERSCLVTDPGGNRLVLYAPL